jgi:putative hemolysin
MTPREDFDVLNGDMTLGDALTIINATKYSRYPVFEGSDDKFIGVVHIKDVLERLAEQPEAARGVKVKDIAVTPMFVPETKLIDDLLRDFQKQRAHLALVINEYGTIVGLVTVDDLIEELVGEIGDETDVDEHVIKRVDKQTIVAHGDAEVRDVNRFLNTRIAGPATKTISRVVIEKAGDIPPQGEEIEIADGVRAVVEEVANLRIMRVRVRKAEQAQLPA